MIRIAAGVPTLAALFSLPLQWADSDGVSAAEPRKWQPDFTRQCIVTSEALSPSTMQYDGDLRRQDR